MVVRNKPKCVLKISKEVIDQVIWHGADNGMETSQTEHRKSIWPLLKLRVRDTPEHKDSGRLKLYTDKCISVFSDGLR